MFAFFGLMFSFFVRVIQTPKRRVWCSSSSSIFDHVVLYISYTHHPHCNMYPASASVLSGSAAYITVEHASVVG